MLAATDNGVLGQVLSNLSEEPIEVKVDGTIRNQVIDITK